MSFILDALRKSETERQKQSAPGLIDTRYKSPEKRKNIWIPLLVIFLAVNAIVVSFLLVEKSPDQTQVVTTTPAVASEARRLPLNRVPGPEVRPLSREAVVAPPAGRAAEAGPAVPAPESVAGSKPAPQPRIEDSPPVTTEFLPSLEQLSADGAVSLPTLHVDIHVHSANAAQRFVFINMNKYREGEVLKEGPRIEEITETGAILNHQGNRFTLERE